jgi:DNA-binding NtrC family response regulator
VATLRRTVLVIDDEDSVIRSLTATLAKLGLKAQVAQSGPEGIECFIRHRNEILLVLADIVMPGMYGTEMAAELRKLDPDVKILLMSGYPEVTPAADACPGCGFVEKPILAVQLLHAIESLAGPLSELSRHNSGRRAEAGS